MWAYGRAVLPIKMTSSFFPLHYFYFFSISPPPTIEYLCVHFIMLRINWDICWAPTREIWRKQCSLFFFLSSSALCILCILYCYLKMYKELIRKFRNFLPQNIRKVFSYLLYTLACRVSHASYVRLMTFQK